MKRSLGVFIVVVLCLCACKKNTQTVCGTQVCTDLFATVGVHFVDKNNTPVTVTNYKVIDLRTNKIITQAIPEGYNYGSGYMEIVGDNDLKSFSTEGDNIQVSATNPETGQVITAIFKISGGCNCHVTKISGPNTIQFS
jgi:hypothetical protein